MLADRDRLLQVLENLVSNAEKFTKPGGGSRRARRRATTRSCSGCSDTGAGIPPEDATVPVRPVRGKRIDRRGTGLGLPIVKGIVEAHGGRVWVESTVGREHILLHHTSPSSVGPRGRLAAAVGRYGVSGAYGRFVRTIG